MIAALGTNILMLLAVLGLGATGLRVLGLWDGLEDREKLAYGIPLGFGALGWLLFFPGIAGFLSPLVLGGGLLICALGAVCWRGLSYVRDWDEGIWWRLGLFCLLIVVVANVINAVPPPTDADSMAYHFALPKQFFLDGQITFVPRAASGAVPLLVHLTYIPALGLGGEWGLTFWTMITGLLVGGVFYIFARRYLELHWALAMVLIFLTTPAVIYGAGSGQVEVRNALFVLAGSFAVVDGLRTGNLRFIVLAGLLAGFFAGAKYPGLMFVGAAGLVVLFHRRWLVYGAVFGVAALVAGFQWYGWNWWHTGDPVFPMLFNALGLPDSAVWTADYNRQFRDVFLNEYRGVQTSLTEFFLYPFKATFMPIPVFQSGRTGLGIFCMAVLPFALGGAWAGRKTLLRHPLFCLGLIALIFYGVWFFAGSPQIVRFLLPIYPLVILCLGVAAYRFATRQDVVRPLALAVGAIIVIQLGGMAVFSKNALQYVTQGETKDAYLERVLVAYGGARWINENLDPPARVAIQHRTVLYQLNVPYFYASSQLQTLIDVSPGSHDPEEFLTQLQGEGITHIMVAALGPDASKQAGFHGLTARLIERKEARVIGKAPFKAIASRALSNLRQGQDGEIWIVKLSQAGL